MCHPFHTAAMSSLIERLIDEDACPGGYVKLLTASLHAYAQTVANRMVQEHEGGDLDPAEVQMQIFNVLVKNLADGIAVPIRREVLARQDAFLLLIALSMALTLEFREEHDGDPDAAHPAGEPENPAELLRTVADHLDSDFAEGGWDRFREAYDRANAEDELGADIEANGGPAATISQLLAEMGFGETPEGE